MVDSAVKKQVRDLVGKCGGLVLPIVSTAKRTEKALVQELIERVKNPFVRAFLQDNLYEFVRDVHAFSGDIFANIPGQSKPFVKSAGLAFYSAPIVSLAPELPWHRIRVAIETAVHETLSAAAGDNHGAAKKIEADTGSGDTADLVERAIAAAFVSACESANGHTGAILVGGLADLLGKYIAIYVAGAIDETEFRLPALIKSADAVSTEPSDRVCKTSSYYSPCNAQPYVEEC